MPPKDPKYSGAKVEKILPPRPGNRDSRVEGNPEKTPPKKYTLRDFPESFPKEPSTVSFEPESYEEENKTNPGLGDSPLILGYRASSSPNRLQPPSPLKTSYKSNAKQEIPISTPTPSSVNSMPPKSSTGTSGTLDIRLGDSRVKIHKGLWDKVRPFILWGLVPIAVSVSGYFESKVIGYKEQIADLAAIRAKLEIIDTKLSENKVKYNSRFEKIDEDMNGAYAEAREAKKQLDNFKKREWEPLKEIIEDRIPVIQGIPEVNKKKK